MALIRFASSIWRHELVMQHVCMPNVQVLMSVHACDAQVTQQLLYLQLAAMTHLLRTATMAA